MLSRIRYILFTVFTGVIFMTQISSGEAKSNFSSWLPDSITPIWLEKPVADYYLFIIGCLGFVSCLIWVSLPSIFPSDGNRKRAIKNGADYIFQDEDKLIFLEIAQRWSNSAHPKDGFSQDDILHLLVSDMWLGKFEDEHGKTKIGLTIVTGTIETLDGSQRQWISDPQYRKEFNRLHLFSLLRRESSRLYNELFPNTSMPESCKDWQTLNQIVTDAGWQRLAKIELRYYDETPPKHHPYPTHMYFRRSCLEMLTLNKNNFIGWLVSNNKRLPKNW